MGSSGGAGGGILYLNITNTLTINGDLKSNGILGASTGSGGGSGGSILIETQKLVGTGTIQVHSLKILMTRQFRLQNALFIFC